MTFESTAYQSTNFESSIHNHCTFCDGISTAREMIEAAIAAGIRDFGFSCHGHDSLMPQYAIDSEEVYASAIRELAREYAGRINISCGIEQEAIEPVQDRSLFDYIIGSVHYVRTPENGPFFAVDGDTYDIMRAIEGPFEGDAMAIVRAYYELMVWQAQTLRPDVIGHFDVVCRNNARCGAAGALGASDIKRAPGAGDYLLFDEDSFAYRDLALQALDAVIETEAIFELNTAGFLKSCERQYPDEFILRRLLEKDALVTVTIDCHDASRIDFGALRARELLRKIGFKRMAIWKDGAFQECAC